MAVFAVDDFTVDEMLHRLGEAATVSLRVDGVGVMGVAPGRAERTRFVHASGGWLEPLEALQELSQTGPCKQAAVTFEVVVCSTAAQLQRWPAFADAAAAAGVRAIVAAPLISRGRCWGVLDLYWSDEVVFDEADRSDIELLAKVAASYLVIADDRREASVARQQLSARLLHDPLTGLANRELIHELICHALADMGRRRRPVGLLFVDLDGFKAVNDTRGHRAGDTVLRTVAQRMRAVMRADDTVARLSGDEFLVLCQGFTGADAQQELADLGQRLLAEIGRPITLDAAPPVTISASIGMAVATGPRSVASFIHDADQAMYQAKTRPGPTIALPAPRSGEAHESDPVREEEIFGALTRGELRVFYQPIVSPLGTIAAVEALLRWDHPLHGVLQASDFVQFAISTGTIIQTGQWLVGEVLAQLRRWQTAFGDAAPGWAFINLSPLELIDPQLPAIIAAHLSRNGLPPSALCLEITEEALTDTRAQPAATYFHGKDHPLALDDFGTGYSSLARLVELPVTYLKLDRSLVARLPAERTARALLNAVLLIAGNTGLQVIAEGVETIDQLATLHRLGCNTYQGYYFAKPMPADEVTFDIFVPDVADEPAHAAPDEVE